jgi:hypothetical protein
LNPRGMCNILVYRNQAYSACSSTVQELQSLRPEDLLDLRKKLRRHKAYSEDLTCNDAIIEMPDQVFLALCSRFWVPIAEGNKEVPEEQKIATLHISYKKGDAALCNNHRPLNHQSHSQKFAERIHAAMGKPFLNRILTKDHFGARKDWGMDLEILVLRDDVDETRFDHKRRMYVSTDVGGAFDEAFRKVIQEVHEVTGYPDEWRRARAELWRGMKAELWLDGRQVGEVEWQNGTLQGGVESGDDYLALSVYQHARIAQQKVTKAKVRQRYFADDGMYVLD